MDDATEVLYEGAVYQVVAGIPVLDDSPALTYQVINRMTDQVEYEDHLLPAAITVATRSEAALMAIKKEEDDKRMSSAGKVIQ